MAFPRGSIFITMTTAVVAALTAFPNVALPCTTAVVSASATVDGRPLLWKNRDADNLSNQLVYREDGKFPYVGLVNGGDALGLEIWAGINGTGFAIMNAASYNLDPGDTKAEGAIMKLALQSCRTVADFQTILERTNETGRDTNANFGVIDAEGGAAYFETWKTKFNRFDATDPKTAPGGYLVRTNYSISGNDKDGSGFIRKDRAESLIAGAVASGKLDARWLLANACRDVANPRIASFPLQTVPEGQQWAYVNDSINRADTSAAVVFVGARPGDDPGSAMAWVILGQPITGAAVPLWVAARGVPKEMATGKDPATLNAAFAKVRDLLFPVWRGDLKRYVDVKALAGPDGGLLKPLMEIEEQNFKAVDEVLKQGPPAPVRLTMLQNRLAEGTLMAVQAVLAAHKAAEAPAKPTAAPPPAPATSR
jgi:hypothetical protein